MIFIPIYPKLFVPNYNEFKKQGIQMAKVSNLYPGFTPLNESIDGRKRTSLFSSWQTYSMQNYLP